MKRGLIAFERHGMKKNSQLKRETTRRAERFCFCLSITANFVILKMRKRKIWRSWKERESKTSKIMKSRICWMAKTLPKTQLSLEIFYNFYFFVIFFNWWLVLLFENTRALSKFTFLSHLEFARYEKEILLESIFSSIFCGKNEKKNIKINLAIQESAPKSLHYRYIAKTRLLLSLLTNIKTSIIRKYQSSFSPNSLSCRNVKKAHIL